MGSFDNMEQNGISKEERNFAMIAHLSSLAGFVFPFGNIIAPLLIWQFKKEDMPFAADQAKECLNFQITLIIGFLICVVLFFLVIGFFLAFVLLGAQIVLTIIAALKANEGIAYRYPYAIRLIK